MKNLYISLFLFFLITSVNGQKEEEWCDCYYPFPGEYDSIPELVISESAKNITLPSKVDNSQKKYFRPIFDQDGGSCAAAAGVSYIYTYMVNRERDLSASDSTDIENMYPPNFTWNFQNKDDCDRGSTFPGNWSVIRTLGVPNIETYGGKSIDKMYIPDLGDGNERCYVWISGYEKYRSAMKNRVIDGTYRLSVNTPDGLDDLKHYLHNLGEGDVEKGGGIVGFVARTGGGMVVDTIHPPSVEAGKHIVLSFRIGSGGHAMTIVGYNDSIKYDFDDKGYFENPENNMAEWDIGALKVANSYGVDREKEDSGFFYMPYRLLAKHQDEGGIIGDDVYLMKIGKEYHSPKVTMRVNMQAHSREDLIIRSGVSENPNEENPTATQIYGGLGFYKGESLHMQGINEDPIELGLDVTNILDDLNPGKFFLKFITRSNFNSGKVNSFSLIDYDTLDDNPPLEIDFSDSDLPVIIESDEVYNTITSLPILYDYLPSSIEEEITIARDFFLQKDIEVTEGGILKISEEGSFSAATDVSITLQPGSALVIEDELILADNNQIIVKEDATLLLSSSSNIEITGSGKIEVQENAYFCIEDGADIHLNDFNSVINLRNGYITGVNTEVLPSTNCFTSPTNYMPTGDGSINEFTEDIYIQNDTLTNNTYYAGRNIYIGYNVTSSIPTGNVLITNNAEIVFDAEQNVLFDTGVKTDPGVSIKVPK